MRIGTFKCLLFGHKFIGIFHEYRGEEGSTNQYQSLDAWFMCIRPTDHCVRCGIKRT